MTPRSSFATVLLAVAVSTAGCGATIAPSASFVSQPSTAISTAPSISPASPSPNGGALEASWVKPAADATLESYTLDLAAKAPGGDVAAVAFTIQWTGGSFAGCRSTKPSAGGRWSCSVDLLGSGVPPGSLDLSVDVVDGAGTVTHDAAPPRSITYAVGPPKPVTTYDQVSYKPTSDGGSIEVDKITWTEPEGYATEFRLYGVSGCPNETSSATDGQACLLEHTKLPPASLGLIKTVKGNVRSIVLTNTTPPDACGPSLWCGPYDSLVLGAYNEFGQSVFAIVVSRGTCFGCTY